MNQLTKTQNQSKDATSSAYAVYSTGYYADPLSPIASTPMKRQRIKKTGDTKTSKQKLTRPSTPRSTMSGATTDYNSFFSPRKLADEYEKDESEEDVKENTWDSNSEGLVEDSSSTQHTQNSQDQPNVDGIFSPALKAPRHCSRVSSAAGSVGPSCEQESDADDAIPPLSQEGTTQSSQHKVNQAHSPLSIQQHEEEEQEKVATDAQDQTTEEGEGDDEEETAVHEFNPFFFMKMLPTYEEIVEKPREIILPAKSRHTPNICLVLDLDETLVHCTVEEVDNPDLQFPVHFNGIEYTVNVRKRPHMEYFLERVSQLFEVVVFTASQRVYAERLLNLLDPHRELIKYRLFREDCLPVEGNFLKDLSVLGRCLSKVLLVDNSPHAFGYQVNNGIPIESWFHDDSDEELLNLLSFLETIHDVDDVRPIVEKQFQIQKLIDNATIEDILLTKEEEEEEEEEDPVTYELERELEREIHVGTA